VGRLRSVGSSLVLHHSHLDSAVHLLIEHLSQCTRATTCGYQSLLIWNQIGKAKLCNAHHLSSFLLCTSSLFYYTVEVSLATKASSYHGNAVTSRFGFNGTPHIAIQSAFRFAERLFCSDHAKPNHRNRPHYCTSGNRTAMSPDCVM